MSTARTLRRGWRLHGDGRRIAPGEVVAPDERLRTPAMLGLGLQHVLAMFGATALVPVLTGFPVSTTILFSGVGTLIFLAVTRGRVPSYTGSSFAFVAPVVAAKAEGGLPAALGGILVAGVLLAVVGLVVDRVGPRPVRALLPPVVTGAIVLLIGLNLAPVAKDQFSQQAGLGLITLLAIVLLAVVARGVPARLSLVLGVGVGYAVAGVLGFVDWTDVRAAAWVGLPELTAPTFELRAVLLIAPAVLLVLLAENAGHVKTVGTMTRRDLDGDVGRSFLGDGLATIVSGAFGGSGTTTYAENIGVMGLTRVYSTLAYLIAGVAAIALGLLPKFGAVIAAIPVGVLGGAVTVLFGLIAILGAKIWIDAGVDFRDPVNLAVAGAPVVVGAADYTLTWGDYTFGGITLGTVAAVAGYQLLRALRPAEPAAATPTGAADATEAP